MPNRKSLSTLATKIKKARKEAGMSQKKLGNALRVSDKAVSSYEVGRALPPLDTLIEIATLTHKPVMYFLDDTKTAEEDLGYKLDKIEKELAAVRQLLAVHSKTK